MKNLLNQINSPQADEVIVIAGPTASGKTALSIQIALKFNGEVISADSRQVYRGLDIGSAKVTNSEICGVPHHLIDVLDPGQKYSVAQFQNQTLNLIKDIQARGKVPIICGGTGLYIESVVEGYRFGENRNLTPSPSSAGEGSSLSSLPSEREGSSSKLKVGYNPKFKVYLLNWPREVLRQRISTRVDQRMEEGMLEEVQGLIKSGVDPQWLISLGLEYRYLTEYLLDSNPNLDETITKLKFKIYQFAKRQDTWFRRWDYAEVIEMA